MPWMAAAIVGSSIIGGAASAIAGGKAASSAQKAADAQAAASREATELQRQQYEQTRADYAPFRQQGLTALAAINQRMGLTNPAIGDAISAYDPAATNAALAGTPKADFASQYLTDNPDVMAEFQRLSPNNLKNNYGITTPQEFAQWHYSNYGQQEGRQWAPEAAAQAPATNAALVNGGGAPAAQGAGTGTYLDAAKQSGVYSSGTSTTRPEYTRPAETTRPEFSAAPTYQAPTLTAAPTYNAPTLTAAPTYTSKPLSAAPTMERPEMAPLDVSKEAYIPSPDYQYQLEQGNRNVLGELSALGGLESGAAMKRLQEVGQNTALADYTQWRDYTTGQYNLDRNRSDTNYAFDANRADRNWQFGATYDQNDNQFGASLANSQWQFGNNFNQSNAQFGANLDSSNWQFTNNFNLNNAQFGQSQASDNWRFLTAAEQQAFESDRGRADSIFAQDRAYGTDVYNLDRAYDTERDDTAINQLLALAGYGPSATGAVANAGQNYASGAQQAGFSAAAAQGNAYTAQGNAWLAGANNFNTALQNGVNAYAYYGKPSGAGASASGAWNPAGPAGSTWSGVNFPTYGKVA